MKIKSIQFKNHEILGNLYLDFCDKNGNIVDTILIAGENGTGKSTILKEIYKIGTYTVDSEMIVNCIIEDKEYELEYYLKDSNGKKYWYVKYEEKETFQYKDSDVLKRELGFAVIFSDVDINFNSSPISNVTSLELDTIGSSRKSDNNLTNQIKQLIIDIQAVDDSVLAKEVRELKNKNISDINSEILNGKMSRFINAFNYIFEDLKYKEVKNYSGHKEIIFERNGKEIFLDNLSSGEKQIIYRGSFILKDLNALKGALVLIDEPEISMHPEWQKKILDFYKKIFIDSTGKQSSQIIAVTHSPFILHNDLRKNDKVIVLVRNENNEIQVLDKPEYYSCDTIMAIKDAFKDEWYESSSNMVYVEGKTDEKYFNKALEVFNIKFMGKFKWIGHLDDKEQEEFTGETSLDKAYLFSVGNPSPKKQIFLYDSDTKKTPISKENSYKRIIKKQENERFKKGIENSLYIEVLKDFDFDKFYTKKEKKDGYGASSYISEFKKNEFCDKICELDNNILKEVFKNLKNEIIELNDLIKKDNM